MTLATADTILEYAPRVAHCAYRPRHKVGPWRTSQHVSICLTAEMCPCLCFSAVGLMGTFTAKNVPVVGCGLYMELFDREGAKLLRFHCTVTFTRQVGKLGECVFASDGGILVVGPNPKVRGTP
jgi:hypothetical protein